MSEGKWVKAKHGEIEKGNTVRVTTKEGPQTTITEGEVTSVAVNRDGSVSSWSVENYENFYANEFIPDEDEQFATLERFVPPFAWPTKLGAVISGTADGREDDTVYAVLVEEAADEHDVPMWWTRDWGAVNMYDIEGLENLTVVSEGVTVKS